MRPGPTTVYLIYSAANGFIFRLVATLFVVFLIVEIGLDPLQLLLMGTALEVSYLVFEIPTGVVADTVSRRLSILIGLFGVGISFLVLGAADSFLVAIVSQVLWGVSATFESGADVAWLTDEAGEDVAREYYVKGEQAFQAASLVGIVVAVLLAEVAGTTGLQAGGSGLRFPFVLAGALALALCAVMLLIMREEGFHPPERGEGKRLHHGLKKTLKEGVGVVRGSAALMLILAVAVLHGASTEGFDRLSDLHFLRGTGLPQETVLWFGVLDGIGLILGLVMLQLVKRKTHLRGHAHVARLLAAIDIALVGSVVVFALTRSFWVAAAAFWVVSGLRNVREPIFTAWVNQGLEPATRATVNSMATQADSVGQAAGGPGLGLIAKGVSVPWAIGISGLLRLPALLLFARAIKRGTVGTVEPADEPIRLED
jgi:DHA3 family tetracycline resistance protein-like MFS transporter